MELHLLICIGHLPILTKLEARLILLLPTQKIHDMKNRISIQLLTTIAIFAILAATSCKKIDNNQNPAPDGTTDIESLNVPATFDFNTSGEVEIKIYAKNNQGEPIQNVRVDIYTDFLENEGKLLASGATDQNGLLHRIHPIPTYYENVVVATRYLGFPSEVEVPVINGEITYTMGGITQNTLKSSAIPFKATNSVFHPMGAWNSQGVPLYLEPENDVIDNDFLADINASFPESQPVPDYHPEYLEPNNEYDFKLLEASDVWITFVHEGAGYMNILGYYTYPINNPPTNKDQIDTINIIFPNVSFQGSGGGLQTGNKVYLGQFPANIGIGWVLIADGWRNQSITNGRGIYFSNPDLNPESTPENRQHAVHLLDNGRGLFLLGFEDLNRDNYSDEDFNDAMFYVTANPIQSVDMSGFQTITYTSEDSDGDGVSDNFDDYPDDAERAFNNYYPSENNTGTLAFEDLWPGKGDYDFNDMIVDYYINQVTNGSNEVVEIFADFTLRAMGASYKNGFGIELPIPPANIAAVTGQVLTPGFLNINTNGTEAGQSNAVIIVFDNGYNLMQYPGTGIGINTDENAPAVDPVTVSLTISLVEPQPINMVGIPSYNPFIFTNQNRSVEVHLADKPPTDLADVSLFGTKNDDSDPAANRFYKTKDNLPWGIHVVETFNYPKEKVQVTQGYNFFDEWAEAAGYSYSNWYKNLPGYRSEQYIYTKE
jgi:LruC domain-containing protein